MHIPALILTAFVLATAALDAGIAGAQEPSPTATDSEREAKPTLPSTAATPGVEEIVIQAGESESAADFSAGDSVAAFDASDLEALGAQSVADLAVFTPNLEIVTAGSTSPTFFIRGVGLNDFNPNSSGAVAVYQDDVAKNAPALQLPVLYDVENVNILRGPQGVGPYRNASAGAIKVYSRRPTGEYGAFLKSEFGNYNAMDFVGAVEAPLYEDILSARLAFRYTDRDGFGRNGCGGAPPMEERGGTQARNGVTTRYDAEGKPISICGELVKGDGVINPPVPSLIEEGLPERVNDRGVWAARGTFLFQPTLDMEWLVTVHGSRRNELSRLGQAYGTAETVYEPECYEALPPTPWPPSNAAREPCRIQNLLGGFDAGEYRPEEVWKRWAEISPCHEYDPVTGTVVANGTCDPRTRDLELNAAQFQTADELGADLDSDPYRGDYNRVGPTQSDIWGIALKGDVVLGESVYLTTVSGYDTYDRIIDIDLDFTPNQLFEFVTEDDGWQFFQDLSFSGHFSEELPVRWELGAYYLMEDLNVDVENFFDPDLSAVTVAGREYNQKLWSAAGYASLEWDFWDDFTLDGGFRWNWEQKKMDFTLHQDATPEGEKDDYENTVWQAPTGTIRLTYRFREDTHAYWKYTRGWKGGHYNATGSPTSLVTTAEPETIDAFEGGLRGAWFEGRLGASFSAFHYDYTNYQIFTAQQQLGTPPEFVVLNASNAEVYGAELDLVARPLPGLYLEARLSWLESKFIDFVQLQQECTPFGLICIVITREIQNSGNPLLNSPTYKVSLTAEQTVPLGRFGSLTARWDGAWSDDTNFDATNALGIPNFQGIQFLPDNTIGQRAYWIHNLNLTYRTPGGAIEVTGWVRNLTDQAYKTFAFDGSTFQDTTIYFTGDPRTYGVTVTATF